jgi:hypothetical protein
MGRFTISAAPQPLLCGSVSDNWVTVYADDIAGIFGPKGFSRGSGRQVSSSSGLQAGMG